MSLRITAYLFPFFKAFQKQIQSDDRRWEKEQWKTRGREGQEERIQRRINEYFADYFERGIPVPWLKIVGEAFIGWVRESFPDFLTRERMEDDEPYSPFRGHISEGAGSLS